MTQEEKILALFDEYFENAPKEEIQKDVEYIDSLGKDGISFELYLETLNQATSSIIAQNGVCDDIAFADLFNNSIERVDMGNMDSLDFISTIKVKTPLIKDGFEIAEENSYAMAA